MVARRNKNGNIKQLLDNLWSIFIKDWRDVPEELIRKPFLTDRSFEYKPYFFYVPSSKKLLIREISEMASSESDQIFSTQKYFSIKEPYRVR